MADRNPDLDEIVNERTNDPRYANACQACFGSGWQTIKKRCHITGLMNSYARPCDCDQGVQFIKSYQAAIERGF